MESRILDIILEVKTMIPSTIGLVIMLVFIKQPVEQFLKGLIFYWGKTFNNDDVVYVDGDKAIIKRIGLLNTHFELIEKSNGVDRIRVVQNHRIQYLKLEKVIVKR
jgi:hypothetical protein